MVASNPKIFFAGDFVFELLFHVVSSALEPVTAIFGAPKEATDDCDFIFIGNKTENTIEIIDPQQSNTIKVKVERQSIEEAVSVLFIALYGEIFVGMDWQDLYLALSGGQEPVLFLGGLSESELFQSKAKYEKAEGLFLHISVPADIGLDTINEVTIKFSDFLIPDANVVWTFSFDENLKESVYSLFVKNCQ